MALGRRSDGRMRPDSSRGDAAEFLQQIGDRFMARRHSRTWHGTLLRGTVCIVAFVGAFWQAEPRVPSSCLLYHRLLLRVSLKRMHETFDHTADLGLRIRAGDLDTLFAEAAEALFSVI